MNNTSEQSQAYFCPGTAIQGYCRRLHIVDQAQWLSEDAAMLQGCSPFSSAQQPCSCVGALIVSPLERAKEDS